MRILYIDQYFSTRTGRSGTRSYEFAKRWAGAGHDVLVITTASAYSDMAGQRRWWRSRDVEGVRVWSLRIAYAQHMSYARRALSFASFMIASTILGLLAPRPDVVFASSTPLSVGVTGAIIAWCRSLPFVFEVRDLWPRAPIELGVIRSPLVKKILRATERWIYRRADIVNTLSPGMAAGVAECGVESERITMIPNACDLDLIPAGRRSPETTTPSIVYAGALGPANGVDDLLDIAARLRRIGRNDIEIRIVGEGSEEKRLRGRAAREAVDNVVFEGAIPRDEVGERLAGAALGVTCFAPVPVLATNSPNKFFDYLAAGLPQITNSPGWIRDLLETSGAGAYWPCGDANAGADLVIHWIDNPARRKQAAEKASELARRFERGALADELLGAFERAMTGPARGWSVAWQGIFDRAAVLAGLLVLALPMALIARRIREEDGGPVFYRSRRVGLGGKPFDMLKFRTMVVGAERQGLGLNVERGDARVTRVGAWLRETSLDELPQIFNVLRGEMRLVGPRPALAEHAARYDASQQPRLRVRPGMTGLAQVNGRNALTWARKLEFDVRYAMTRHFWLDLSILLRTLGVVLRKEGLYEPDAGLADEFNRFDDPAAS